MNDATLHRKRLFTALAVTAAVHFAWSDSITTTIPAGVKPLQSPTLHNLFALGTNVYSGSSPDTEQAFVGLVELGVKTVISVDGARPDVETARKHGLRYVHLPHGYDGINANLQLKLARAAESFPGAIYVHCHHGEHRGPVAAAVICMAQTGWSCEQAEAWLVAAGTATNYTGLYEVVRQFQKPTATQLAGISSDLPETEKVSGLVDAMVAIDERWEHLKAVRAAGYQTPKEQPDVKPANEAVILWEQYREAQRLPNAAHHGADFIKRLVAAEQEARKAERLLRSFAADAKPETRTHLDRIFEAIGKTCASCHKAYRDTKHTGVIGK